MMTLAELDSANEIQEEIKSIKAIISDCSMTIEIHGRVGENKYEICSFNDSKTHGAIIQALNDRLETLQEKFKNL